jgi:hypothetical protein
VVRDEDGILELVQKLEHDGTPINGIHVFRGCPIYMLFEIEISSLL